MGLEKMVGTGVLPGPAGIFASGFDLRDAPLIEEFLNSLSLSSVPVVFCRDDMAELTLEQVLTKTSRGKILAGEKMPRVLIASGISRMKLKEFMEAFPGSGIKRAIFAVSTEKNLKFTIREILTHLLKEHQAMKKSTPKKRTDS